MKLTIEYVNKNGVSEIWGRKSYLYSFEIVKFVVGILA